VQKFNFALICAQVVITCITLHNMYCGWDELPPNESIQEINQPPEECEDGKSQSVTERCAALANKVSSVQEHVGDDYFTQVTFPLNLGFDL